jgi:hypothetical protein
MEACEIERAVGWVVDAVSDGGDAAILDEHIAGREGSVRHGVDGGAAEEQSVC